MTSTFVDSTVCANGLEVKVGDLWSWCDRTLLVCTIERRGKTAYSNHVWVFDLTFQKLYSFGFQSAPDKYLLLGRV